MRSGPNLGSHSSKYCCIYEGNHPLKTVTKPPRLICKTSLRVISNGSTLTSSQLVYAVSLVLLSTVVYINTKQYILQILHTLPQSLNSFGQSAAFFKHFFPITTLWRTIKPTTEVIRLKANLYDLPFNLIVWDKLLTQAQLRTNNCTKRIHPNQHLADVHGLLVEAAKLRA